MGELFKKTIQMYEKENEELLGTVGLDMPIETFKFITDNPWLNVLLLMNFRKNEVLNNEDKKILFLSKTLTKNKNGERKIKRNKILNVIKMVAKKSIYKDSYNLYIRKTHAKKYKKKILLEWERIIDTIKNKQVDLKFEKKLKLTDINNFKEYHNFIKHSSFLEKDNIYIDSTLCEEIYDGWLKKVKLPKRDYCDNMMTNLLVVIGNRNYEMLNNGDGNMHRHLSEDPNYYKVEKKIRDKVKEKYGFNMPLYYNFSSTKDKYYNFERNYERLIDFIQDNDIDLSYTKELKIR